MPTSATGNATSQAPRLYVLENGDHLPEIKNWRWRGMAVLAPLAVPAESVKAATVLELTPLTPLAPLAPLYYR